MSTDEPVDFEKQPVEGGDFRRITNHFRGIHERIYLQEYISKTGRCQHVTGWI